MPELIDLATLESRIKAYPDAWAHAFLPSASLAREIYELGIVHAERPHTPEDAHADECDRYGLTPEQWSEQMKVALRALKHDAKLGILEKGRGVV